MSSLLEQNVATIATIQVPGTGSEFVSYSYDLFDVPGDAAARIESLTMEVFYPTPTDVSDCFEVALKAQNGNVLDRQPSPIIGATGTVVNAFLTWVRHGNDLAQSGVFEFESLAGPNKTDWWRGALPDFIMQKQGSVVLNVYRASDGSFNTITIRNIVLSYTPAAGGGSGTETDVFPLLLPLADS